MRLDLCVNSSNILLEFGLRLGGMPCPSGSLVNILCIAVGSQLAVDKECVLILLVIAKTCSLAVCFLAVLCWLCILSASCTSSFSALVSHKGMIELK